MLKAIYLFSLSLLFSLSAFAQTSTSAAQNVPLESERSEAEFWKPKAKLLSFKCKNLKLEARSRIDPSIEYPVSEGLMNEKDCKATVKQMEKKGCYCDDYLLKCMETEKFEPVGFVCPTGFFCFVWTGKKTGVLKVKEMGNHTTRKACEKEWADLDR